MVRLIHALRSSPTPSLRLPSMIAFDKDGTIIDFHSSWSPWFHGQVNRLEEYTKKSLRKELAHKLGFCERKNKVVGDTSLLAHAPMPVIRDAMMKVLIETGSSKSEAVHIMDKCYQDVDTSECVPKPIGNVVPLLESLRNRGIKTAVVTSDSRKGTESHLLSLNVRHLFDEVICGDDPTSIPKPGPENMQRLCKKFGIVCEDSVVVGDTRADLMMARSAGCFGVGVLSGVGSHNDLRPFADVLVDNLHSLDKLFFEKHMKMTAFGRV